MTDDAWQAENTDGYLACSGHWIEEVSPGVWESREALLGFTRINYAHNGVRLGQALYKIVARLGIQKRHWSSQLNCLRGMALFGIPKSATYLAWHILSIWRRRR
ncbi:hypothetical protein B0H19DRAFT_684815 [Mycena capillaripes]|nr:hypothetical protein B0H19DRAFT_684815 [Mycena capillaripes]